MKITRRYVQDRGLAFWVHTDDESGVQIVRRCPTTQAIAEATPGYIAHVDYTAQQEIARLIGGKGPAR